MVSLYHYEWSRSAARAGHIVARNGAVLGMGETGAWVVIWKATVPFLISLAPNAANRLM